MEKEKNNNSPVLGFDELFDTGIIVDGTGTDLEEVDVIMKEYFREN